MCESDTYWWVYFKAKMLINNLSLPVFSSSSLSPPLVLSCSTIELLRDSGRCVWNITPFSGQSRSCHDVWFVSEIMWSVLWQPSFVSLLLSGLPSTLSVCLFFKFSSSHLPLLISILFSSLCVSPLSGYYHQKKLLRSSWLWVQSFVTAVGLRFRVAEPVLRYPDQHRISHDVSARGACWAAV